VLAPNVVAWLPGRDPLLRDTAVVVSAHYDHLGIGPEVEGDRIYNGVIDNAIGVAGVLEIARILSEVDPRPRRSVVFLFSTAEEEGLLGTQYFLDHPPLPLPQMVANVNVDGLAFQDSFTDVIGVGGELSTLGKDLEEVAKSLALEVGEASPELWSSEAFTRSDQAAFAERGVPSVLINEGFNWRHLSRGQAENRTIRWLQEIYHSPADDLNQALSWTAARQHAGVIAALVLRLADSRDTPEWYPGVSYAYERALSRAIGR
jgi:Zn-dependent M28 family amino/carboxypeptidase